MVDDRYKWIALSNTTLAMLLATIDASIMLIAMPDVFRGIHLNPLEPGNSFYLLWMILGFLVVSSVLVVSLGSLGDMYGRVRMYNLGFVIYTVASLILAVDPLHGGAGADWLIVFRIFQGVGAAFLLANTGAILTDAFPSNQRGLALGITNVVGISGTFIGLVLGGLLAPIDWRLIFLVSVPPGVVRDDLVVPAPTRDRHAPQRRRSTGSGNLTFAVGLVLVMIGITYGIRPYGSDPMGWHSPFVLGSLGVGLALLVAFVVDRASRRAPDVRAQPLPDPRVLGRHARDVSLVGVARRADVHADHLAAGHLAAAPRLRLRVDPVARGDLDAAAHRRLPRRRADLRLSLRPLWLARVRDGGHARLGGSPSCCSSGCRSNFDYAEFAWRALPDGRVDGLLRIAEPGRGDEQPSRRSTAAPAAA